MIELKSSKCKFQTQIGEILLIHAFDPKAVNQRHPNLD